MNENQFGLARSIPETVKLLVRQECGFGCVICGSTIVEYEHFLPDFKDAKDHRKDSIALLCPTHHAQATKGIIPKEQVQEARLSPIALSRGFATENHPIFRGIPSLELGGGIELNNVLVPISVFGENIFQFTPDSSGLDITGISMRLSDQSGATMLKVRDNEWMVEAGNWDFQSIANRYIIKSQDRSCHITLIFEAPKKIVIREASFYVNGLPMVITDKGLDFAGFHMADCMFSDCGIGVAIG